MSEDQEIFGLLKQKLFSNSLSLSLSLSVMIFFILGYLLHQAAINGEVLAVISDSVEGPTMSCTHALSLATELLNM